MSSILLPYLKRVYGQIGKGEHAEPEPRDATIDITIIVIQRDSRLRLII